MEARLAYLAGNAPPMDRHSFLISQRLPPEQCLNARNEEPDLHNSAGPIRLNLGIIRTFIGVAGTAGQSLLDALPQNGQQILLN